MSTEVQATGEAQQPVQSDKEINFAKVRKQLEEERYARQVAEQKAAEIEKVYQERMAAMKRDIPEGEDEPDDEPYVDHKRLAKKLAKFEQNLEQKIDKKAEEKASRIFEEHRKQEWLRNNADFYEIMGHAQAFADRDPELAETILQMPDTFERQKLVYKNIKALNLHKKEEPKSSVQDKIEANRRSPYYQPSGVASPGYSTGGDFSSVGQKNAYQKMQELKARLRI